jgi:hypothetical protein
MTSNNQEENAPISDVELSDEETSTSKQKTNNGTIGDEVSKITKERMTVGGKGIPLNAPVATSSRLRHGEKPIQIKKDNLEEESDDEKESEEEEEEEEVKTKSKEDNKPQSMTGNKRLPKDTVNCIIRTNLPISKYTKYVGGVKEGDIVVSVFFKSKKMGLAIKVKTSSSIKFIPADRFAKYKFDPEFFEHLAELVNKTDLKGSKGYPSWYDKETYKKRIVDELLSFTDPEKYVERYKVHTEINQNKTKSTTKIDVDSKGDEEEFEEVIPREVKKQSSKKRKQEDQEEQPVKRTKESSEQTSNKDLLEAYGILKVQKSLEIYRGVALEKLETLDADELVKRIEKSINYL